MFHQVHPSHFWVMLILLVLPYFAFAQHPPIRQYATQKIQQEIQQLYPDIAAKQQAIELQLQDDATPITGQEKTIPVVFHIIGNNLLEFPDITQITRQLYQLNEQFSINTTIIEHPADTLEGFAEVQAQNLLINFCPARRGATTGSGTSVEPINYNTFGVEIWSMDDILSLIERTGITPVDPKRFLNIYILDLEEPYAGYATFPASPLELDGIVIDKDYFGLSDTPPYNEAKTLTHLIGNYLGLHDLWNDETPCADDGVKDTPLANVANYGCPSYQHVNMCIENDAVEMTMNYMDNTDDACVYMFTIGQMERMHQVLEMPDIRGLLSDPERTLCSELPITPLVIESREEESNLPSNSNHFLPQLHIFPNPARQQITLQIKHQESLINSQILIYSSAGKIVHQQSVESVQDIKLPTKNWSTGIYFIHLHTEEHTLIRRLAIL